MNDSAPRDESDGHYLQLGIGECGRKIPRSQDKNDQLSRKTRFSFPAGKSSKIRQIGPVRHRSGKAMKFVDYSRLTHDVAPVFGHMELICISLHKSKSFSQAVVFVILRANLCGLTNTKVIFSLR